MNDVLREIVLTRGDKYLCARNLVRAVAGRNRARLYKPEIGAAMGFGQAHRPGPFPGHHFRQIKVLEIVAGVGFDGFVGTVRQARIHAEGHVGRAQKLLGRETYGVRQALAAILRGAGEARPAGLSVKIVGFLEAAGRADNAVFKGASLGVALLIERLQHRLAKLRRLFENAGDEIRGGVLETGQGRKLPRVENLIQNKAILIKRRFVTRHWFSLSGRSAPI